MFSSVTAEMWKPLQKLTLVKTDWRWNRVYQDLYERAKNIIKKNACTKFYGISRLLYLETDALDITFGARLLQLRDGMDCGHDKVPANAALHQNVLASKSLLSAQQCCSKVVQKALGILHSLEMFHNYCFTEKVCTSTDHKPQSAIISKDVVMLFQWLWCILMHIQ